MESLRSYEVNGGTAESLSPEKTGWRLCVPAGPAGQYRLAQLDDYRGLARRRMLWRAPSQLQLRARASAQDIPGTWGFGLWNDPFAVSLGFGGARRLPALPNTAWFFFASPPNHLSLRDDLPAQGALAAVFRSPAVPMPLMAMGAPLLPLLALRPAARLARKLGRLVVREDGVQMDHDVTAWHTYALVWDEEWLTMRVDGQDVLRTSLVPRPPLGLVIWIDNQYAAFTPEGRLGWGTLANEQDAWFEIEEIAIA